ncbi:MAG: Gfo/Idh/MocA family oxidoreductase [Rhodothermales bacterium]|nr:Gfo/Idh/MocA family oxidoreductase [Rhodothermales bacterium]
MTSSQDNKPQIALIGCGHWGRHIARNLHDLEVLHTVVDPSPDVSRYLKETYGDVVRTTLIDEVLTNTEISGVAIASPPSTHAELARVALNAGKDVLVEKPMCLLAEEAIELNELASRNNRILMVGHLLWYHNGVLRLKEIIDSGDLGRIQYIHSNRLNIGRLRREENVLWSFAPHDVSVAMGLLGEMPESVQATGCSILDDRVADTTISLMRFPSGAYAHIFVSWLHPFKEQKLVIVGDRKMAVLDDSLPWSRKLQLYPHAVKWTGGIPVANKADVEYVDLAESEPLQQECAHFVECMIARTPPRTDGEEALRVLKALSAWQQSMDNNQITRLNDDSSVARAFFAHDSAVIDDDSAVGDGTKIWHFSHIMSGAKIGQRCNIGQNVVIGPNVTIGEDCKIQNNVSIYEGVVLEDRVFCGPSAVFTNVVNPRAHVDRRHEFKGTLVKTGATIGANSTIVCGNTLGKYSFIGAGAVLTKDVPDFALVLGNPARQVGWMCSCGDRLKEDLRCGECGMQFQLAGAAIAPVE